MKKQDVIDYFSSGEATARALGISGAAVCQWGDVIPEKQALRIEKITKGKLKVGNEYDR